MPQLREKLAALRKDNRPVNVPVLVEASRKGQEVLVRPPSPSGADYAVTRRLHAGPVSENDRTEPVFALKDLVGESSLYFELRPRVDKERTEILVGRDRENDVVLFDDTISGTHAVLQARGESWWLRDRNSSNGTFINQKRLGSKHVVVLESGDCVRFGQRVFYFVSANRLGLFFKMWT